MNRHLVITVHVTPVTKCKTVETLVLRRTLVTKESLHDSKVTVVKKITMYFTTTLKLVTVESKLLYTVI